MKEIVGWWFGRKGSESSKTEEVTEEIPSFWPDSDFGRYVLEQNASNGSGNRYSVSPFQKDLPDLKSRYLIQLESTKGVEEEYGVKGNLTFMIMRSPTNKVSQSSHRGMVQSPLSESPTDGTSSSTSGMVKPRSSSLNYRLRNR